MPNALITGASGGIGGSAAPDRLAGLGLVPLQHPDLAIEALTHALKAGLRGVEIASHAGGVELSDPRLEPFWTAAAEQGAVVFLHPFGCTLDERLRGWYLSNIVGQPVEHAVALSHVSDDPVAELTAARLEPGAYDAVRGGNAAALFALAPATAPATALPSA